LPGSQTHSRDLAFGGSPPPAGALGRIVAKEEAAFRAVVVENYGRVVRMAARLLNNAADAEDVAQEAFLKLWNDAAGIREESSLPAWLMRVASNLALDRMRRKAPVAVTELPDIVDETGAADRDQRRAGISARINSALAALPERQRLALVLVHLEGCEQKVAAAALEVSIEALESLLARARRGLRASLRDDWQSLLADIGQL
jgi:RNA polymerase sigma-70 factor (ECF subfamily)